MLKMSLRDEMHTRLTQAFAPERLEIRDESEAHRGHAGYGEGGESHWSVAISAPVFDGMSRLERSRAVHAALGRDIVARIHALELSFMD